MTLRKVDLTPRVGTEIQSDVETLLSGKHAAEIRETLEMRGFLLFRELNLSEDQQQPSPRPWAISCSSAATPC